MKNSLIALFVLAFSAPLMAEGAEPVEAGSSYTDDAFVSAYENDNFAWAPDEEAPAILIVDADVQAFE